MIIDALKAVTEHHKNHCSLYKDYVMTFFGDQVVESLVDLPYLPVKAFKKFEIKSIPEEEIYKVMRSSGTSGEHSQIYLDKETAQLQTRALVNSFKYNFGGNRFPMLIIDTESTIRNRMNFSARTAAINGFSMFSRGRCFALDDDLSINHDRVTEFLSRHAGERIFIFGFTFLVWSAFFETLQKNSTKVDLSNSFLLHGGGWKKLESLRISNEDFKNQIKESTGCSSVHNYYGMVEQTGTIFIECKNGRLHASENSSAIVRDPATHQPLDHGYTGLLQVFSTIQKSYPGHSLLTEDVGRTFDGSACGCGCSRVIVEIDGRLAKAEVRGCSDAYS